MLPKDRRLQSDTFEKTFEYGKRYDGEFVYAQVHEHNQPTPAEFAVVVPKSLVDTAVKRNKIRRRAYHALSDIYSGVPAGYNMIFFLKSAGTDVSVETLREDMEDIMHNAGVV